MKKVKLGIQGMHCASCAVNIGKSLKTVAGVKDANVSLIMKSGTVDCEDNVNPEDLKKAVARVGYKVTTVQEN